MRSERSLAASLSTLLRPILDRATHRLNRSSPFAPIALFLIVVILLTAARIAPYGYRMSALIGMEQQFIDLNPGATFEGIVVFKDSGYDGQFFYLIARDLFDPSFDEPVLDTYRMRMGRIGMSLLVGLPASLLGWQSYGLIAFAILQLLQILAFLSLRSMLSEKNRYLALFFLFSPFSYNSSLLLVSDSLMVAVAVLGLSMLEKGGFRFSADGEDRTDYRSRWTIGATLLLCFLVTIRDTALFALAPIGLLFLYRKSLRGVILAALPVLVFLAWMAVVRLLETHPGSNPVHYDAKLGGPMVGFFQSLNGEAFASIKGAAREMSKYLNLLYLLIMVSTFFYIRSLPTAALFSPLVFTAALSVFSVVEYWATFDNVNRMFTLSIPIMALLRDRIPNMRSHGLFLLSVVFLLLLAVRLVWLKPAMAFTTIGL
ncbi:hypothetical protein [Leptonema illini]|uniref:Glycosyltransferase RgtA/B/C/D-like domain-containing protein n=1 Tax=Leptonema illini DSM 21528 TaxID=929563 RepID=H2CAA0_9LEPT|nr:hypothetical protein [Leptonema illini]EHQ06258.1 hypothetical protein Lepil_1571 [Leptonema illini DSM 21528]